MVDKNGRPRKAVGSNASSRKGKSMTRGRPRQASSHTEEYHSAHDDFEDAAMSPKALSSSQQLEFQEAQAEPEPQPCHASIRTATTVNSQSNADEDEHDILLDSASSSASSEWEDIPSPTSTSLPTATHFPGTWPAALHDTSVALSQVSSATLSYASAIASSGIGRASWSIGTAALSSTNKAALSFTAWGMARTGVMTNELPAPIRRWVQGKQERDRRQRRAEQRRKEKRRREAMMLDGSFRDGRGEFVLETHEMDGTENIRDQEPAGRLEANQEDEVRGQEYYEEEEEEEDALLRVFQSDDEDEVL
jgi:hypothetical protein